MLTITTIFLGLVAGPQTIELVAPAETARIELAVDGAACATIASPPWRATCDLGPRLRPLRLRAVGFDGEGREIGRAERVVNVFRAPAEVAIHLEPAAAGGLRARLVAGSLTGERPRSTALELDGVPLPAPGDLAAIELPPLDLAQPHLLRAELDWSDEVAAAGELVFGGRYGDAIASELTAVPVELERGAALAELDGALVTPDGAARVVALDRGPAEIFVVLDPDAIRPLARTAAIAGRMPAGSTFRSRPGGDERTRTLGGGQQRFLFTLPRGDRVRLLWPWPEQREIDGRRHALFPPSPPFTAADGGFFWVVTQARLPPGRDGAPRLVEAAAVAGMIAAGRERRRAVVVVAGGGDDDPSRLAPESLRDYLAAVRVPLFVWRTAKRTNAGPDRWAEVALVDSSVRLQQAFRALERALERQQIAWIEGAYLPGEVRLVAGNRVLRLAGESAP